MGKNYTKKSPKQLLLLLLAFNISLLTLHCFPQGAAINTSGSSADPSAILDVSSTNSGILIPRLTKLQRSGISQPAEGLMIYQTDDTTGFWYFNGNVWKQIGTAPGAAISAGTSVGNTLYWNGTNWVESSNIYNTGGSVGIGTNSPEPTAKVEINSNTRGFLIPRMTTAERNAIVNPAEGLQIFNTTTKCFEYYAYGFWQIDDCATCFQPDNAGSITGNIYVCQGDNNVVYSVPAINYATSYIWSYTGTGVTINGNSESITIDFSGSATSGNLTVKGTNQCGDGLVSPNFTITVNSVPSSPTAGTHIPLQTAITWNWNPVLGATGYKYNTINNFSTATDNGTNTSFTQAGLICNTSYNLYVWAYNNCGHSSTTVLTKTTDACFTCPANLVVNHNSTNGVAPVTKSVTYGIIPSNLSGTYKCWITQNLGSSNQPTSEMDATENAAGWYWQFNRKQGYKHDGLDRTPNTSWASGINESSDWISANDPCTIELGSTWRIPTITEWSNTEINAGWANYADAYNSVLKLHGPGTLYDGGGTLSGRGDIGYYWSSTQISFTHGNFFYTHNTISNTGGGSKAWGFSIRCLRD